MPACAPARSLRRRDAPRGVPGSVALLPERRRRGSDRVDPPFEAPPRPPETGGGGGGNDGGGDFDDERVPPGHSLPLAVWVIVAATALAVPAGFLAAAFVGRPG